MQMDATQRIPYFTFVDREAGADTEATKAAGYEVPRMRTFILITPHGHRGDPMEFFAEEFIERKGMEAKQGNYPHQWVSEFKANLSAFREGKVLPRTGTPLMTWERILKTRREQLARRFPTLEDLAETPDSSLGEVGMDGRVLRDMARADIQAKKDLSPVVMELANANETIRRQTEQIDSLTRKVQALADRMDEPKRGRPRREEVEET
jgi:hypothetical protein